MEELMGYFQKQGDKFGNPDVVDLERPAAFDLPGKNTDRMKFTLWSLALVAATART